MSACRGSRKDGNDECGDTFACVLGSFQRAISRLSMNVDILLNVLGCTVNPAVGNAVLQQAEQALAEIEQAPGYLPALLQIVANPQIPEALQHAAVLRLKNLVRIWRTDYESMFSDVDRQVVRDNIFETIACQRVPAIRYGPRPLSWFVVLNIKSEQIFHLDVCAVFNCVKVCFPLHAANSPTTGRLCCLNSPRGFNRRRFRACTRPPPSCINCSSDANTRHRCTSSWSIRWWWIFFPFCCKRCGISRPWTRRTAGR